MERITVAIEVADENLDPEALRARAETEYGVRIVLNPRYANALVLVVSTPDPALEAALERFGVRLATPSTLPLVLCDPKTDPTAMPRRRLRLMFREFKSHPLSKISLRGKDPKDPAARNLKLRAKRFKEGFYERLAEFIADNPGLSYKDYWDADGRPYERQWPEYRAAVRRAKEIKR